MTSQQNLETARAFLKALEEFDVAALSSFFAAGAEQTEWPNRLKPDGDSRSPAQMIEDFEKSKGILSAQRYEVTSEIASGDMVAIEFVWTGTLAIPIGALAAGDEMRSHCAVVMEFRDGLIFRQRNYDCFDAF